MIEEDPSISLLVLGTATGREGPGPLVTYLVGQMGGQMRVPVTLVPGPPDAGRDRRGDVSRPAPSDARRLASR